MHPLLNVGLDVKFVQTLARLLRAHLLDGSEERVGFVQTVQEADGLVDHSWVVLPLVEHLESLLHVVEPGVESACCHPRFFGPLSRHPVKHDVVHELFHAGRHSKLTLESEIKVLEVGGYLFDEIVNQLALLDVYVLIGSTVVVGQLRLNLVDGKFLLFDLALFEDADGEFLRNVNNGRGTFVTAASRLGL